ncbi:MAG: alanine racemase [Candidatus Neomarinimicrobiota bacterium]|tara:strand:+ start:1904 stop:3001 length:1098 start_codon:yes stop_codon:yes gene_type:complete
MSHLGPKVHIDLHQLKKNYQIVKSEVGDIPIMATVKANAYGHGAIEVSKALEEEGVRYLAVFTIDEGIELRDAGIKTDIFIYAKFDPTRIEDATKHNLTLNISSFDDLKVLKAHTGNTIKVHLKIDTGMTRLGVPLDQAEAFLKEADQLDSIELEGLYSHFATADEGDLSYANSQLSKFNEVIEISKKLEMSPTFIHCSNSGAILNVNESRFNMIRTGMLLYGAFPSDEVPQELPIKPVMTFTAPVVEIRDVKAGTHISYGGVYTTQSDTRIAVVQAGFADGVPRPWYIDGFVKFKNKNLKITGRICMDQLMIDIGSVDINYGDEVLIFGSNDHGSIDINHIAKKIDSTSYVLVTAIGIRPERIY